MRKQKFPFEAELVTMIEAMLASGEYEECTELAKELKLRLDVAYNSAQAYECDETNDDPHYNSVRRFRSRGNWHVSVACGHAAICCSGKMLAVFTANERLTIVCFYS